MFDHRRPSEDNQISSGAGEFDSILNVDPKDQVAITDAVDQVIEAYSKKITSDYLLGQEILIQDMIDNVSMSGVVFVRLRQDRLTTS